MVDGFNGPSQHAGKEDYDLLPYPSMPFAYTQPARLAALTGLFGLNAPDAIEARVLELGCASGGNIIPLALRYPRARFVGLDLSHRHVADGCKRISALGLSNIQLQQADFAEPDYRLEQFDYIICHGVFSWVPRRAQEAIFRICSQALAPNGVAAVSYNVLPGWYLRKIVRDICIHHVDLGGSPRARVAKAREALQLIAGSMKKPNAYGLLIRDEARRLAGRPAAYIMGEFLAADNSPCYFHEFVARAEAFHLTYVCEADLNASIPEIQDAEVRRRNKLLAGSDHLALEQCIDFFTGRTFRRSILVRSTQSEHIRRNRNLQRLRSLHFSGSVGKSLEANAGGLSPPTANRRNSLTSNKPLLDETLRRLTDAYPGTLTYQELISSVEKEAPKASSESISKALFTLLLAGQATASTVPSRTGRASAARTSVWRLARLEAAAKQPWLTSLNHSPVPLQHVPVALLPYLDGNRDCDALRPLIIQALLDGSIAAGAEVSHRKPAQLESAADHYLKRALDQLESFALLEP
jgi:methyltransferase-like protein/trans-aconitate methyltransferase